MRPSAHLRCIGIAAGLAVTAHAASAAEIKLIASRAPKDIPSLEAIRGMGPYKLQMYGEALLAAINGGE